MLDYYIYQDKYILGVTSIWLLVPFFYNILYSNDIYIKFLIIITTLISTIFWGYCSYNSLFHNLDRIFARILFILLTLFSYNNYYILPASCLIFYYLSNYFSKKNKKNYSLICHLIFRYIGFWWTMLIFSNLSINFNIFIFYSLFYCFHIFFLYKIICYKNQLQVIQENFTIIYNFGIVQIIIILFILLFIHLLAIEYNK